MLIGRSRTRISEDTEIRGKPQYYILNRPAEDFGYQPMSSALVGILGEIDFILKKIAVECKYNFLSNYY